MFSIVTVTCNNLNGLKRTATSVRGQTSRDYEWIVVDGGSDDGTVEYLAGTDARWISEPDRGIYDAMNKGIDRASGNCLLFLNAGDELAAPDVLERLSRIEADFIYGDALENGFCKLARPAASIAYGMFTHHQAMVYRRALIGNLRYDLKYKIAADYKFTLLFLQKARETACADFPVCLFESGGVSQRHVRVGRREQFEIRKETGLCSLPVNVAVSGAQNAAMIVRRLTPGLYWRLRSSGNSETVRRRA